MKSHLETDAFFTFASNFRCSSVKSRIPDSSSCGKAIQESLFHAAF